MSGEGAKAGRLLAVRAAAVVALGALVLPARPAQAQLPAQPHPTEIVVMLASPMVLASDVLSGLPSAGPARAAVHDRYVLSVSAADVQSVLGRLRHDPRVSYASIPHLVRA